jgi:hypothetical protein
MIFLLLVIESKLRSLILIKPKNIYILQRKEYHAKLLLWLQALCLKNYYMAHQCQALSDSLIQLF